MTSCLRSNESNFQKEVLLVFFTEFKSNYEQDVSGVCKAFLCIKTAFPQFREGISIAWVMMILFHIASKVLYKLIGSLLFEMKWENYQEKLFLFFWQLF